jgi:hypothetical protein
MHDLQIDSFKGMRIACKKAELRHYGGFVYAVAGVLYFGRRSRGKLR